MGAMVAGAGAAALITCLAGPARATAQPATTASALSTLLVCDFPSGPMFDCDMNISGGTPPYTTTWGGTNVQYTATYTYDASGFCTYNAKWVVTVRDSAGATSTSTQYHYCNPYG